MALLEERRERLKRVDRVALVVKQHVRGVEVDADAGPVEFLEEESQRLGGFLPGLEAKLYAVRVECVGDLRDAAEQLGEAGVALLVRKEAGMKGDQLQAELGSDVGDRLDVGPVSVPMLVRHDAARFLDRVERRVILADRAEHAGDDPDTLAPEQLAGFFPGLGSFA